MCFLLYFSIKFIRSIQVSKLHFHFFMNILLHYYTMVYLSILVLLRIQVSSLRLTNSGLLCLCVCVTLSAHILGFLPGILLGLKLLTPIARTLWGHVVLIWCCQFSPQQQIECPSHCFTPSAHGVFRLRFFSVWEESMASLRFKHALSCIFIENEK